MNRFFLILIAAFSFSFISLAQTEQTAKDKYGNTYKYYTNDPSNSRWYTTKNGLTVILSSNRETPRIQTLVAVKAGSSSDPAENTGLAHYLEHLLFKGTDKYGTLDFEKEKVYLDQIDELYEQYNQTKDEAKRKEIYRAIDSVSNLAAKYSIANEYDKMVQSIGANGTNAFTSFEQTVYVNNIPSNQIENWLTIEAERFRNPILRLFHTELEAVYEEKNISLDNDNRKVYESLFAEVFANHNYGKQTTIGTVEHLKNPSLNKIREYFYNYYVPNNMAIIMAGDLDMAETFVKIKENFSYMESKIVPTMTFEPEVPLIENKEIRITGPDAASLTIGFRVPSAKEDNAELAELVDLILDNSKAGLINLNLVKAQKVLGAGSSVMQLKDRGLHYFYGQPLENQSLEDVRDLIYAEIEKLKNGEFDMRLITSIVANQKVSNIKRFENASGTAYSLMNAFILGTPWGAEIAKSDKMLKYSKKEIMDYAKNYLGANHVIVYKNQGEKTESIKIEKPTISQVELNRGKNSDFAQKIMDAKVPSLAVQVLNYEEEIIKSNVGDVPVWKVKNGDEQLFTMYYLLDIGSRHDLKLSLAVNYLKLLGTSKYSADDIANEFYKLACDFGVSTSDDESYVYVSGLAENFDKAVKLFEHLLKDAKADEESLKRLKSRIKKSREDAKLNKRTIMSKLASFTLYGPMNPANYELSDEQLYFTTAEELVGYINNLNSYPHKVLYSGPLSISKLKKCVKKYHKVPKTFLPIPEKVKFPMNSTDRKVILFAHYNMVQAEINWVKPSNELDINESTLIRLFNEYFGGGMSSVVFQEIRESKALAYSTYAFYRTANELKEQNRMIAYVGTQADKYKEAIAGMEELLQNFTSSENSFENAVNSVRQDISSSRTRKMGIIFSYLNNQKLGIDYDRKKESLEILDKLTLADIASFHADRVAGNYLMCILADREKLTPEMLAEYGEFREVTLEMLFGY
jgi:predicted Zn-dependent peptidase